MGTVLARLAAQSALPAKVTKGWLRATLRETPRLEFITIQSPVERGGRHFSLPEAWDQGITFVEVRQGDNLLAGIELTRRDQYKVH